MRVRPAVVVLLSCLSSCLSCLGLAACGDSGVATVRVVLDADLSGTVVTSNLAAPAAAGPLEASCNGIAWSERANLHCARGTFASVAELRVVDVTYAAGTTPAGFSYVQVTVPRGAAAQWPTALLPAEVERDRALRALDPHGELRGAAGNVLFEVEVPGELLGNQVTPQPRGTSVEHARRRCSLVVPVARAAAEGEPLVWLMTWK